MEPTPPPKLSSGQPRAKSMDYSLSMPNFSLPRTALPDAQQQGRSSTGLAAEAAAAALRDFARGRPQSKRSSTTSHSSSNQSRLSLGNSPTLHPHPLAPRPPPRRNMSLPALSEAQRPLSMPLPLPSASRFLDADTSTIPALSTPGESEKNAIPPLRSNPELSRAPVPPRQDTPRSISTTRTPKTWTDLGRDYSRYPLPSRTMSFSTHSTPGGLSSPPGGRTPLLTSAERSSPLQSITNIGVFADPEKASYWLLDDRIGAPYTSEDGSFPLYTDEKELDDDMHTPMPDDDLRLKPTFKDFCAPRQLMSLFGLVFMVVGILAIFVLLPVLSFTGHALYNYPYGTADGTGEPLIDPADHVNDNLYPLLQNIRTGLIDPATPKSAKTRKTFDGDEWVLVFSDEFDTPNRTFYPGDDPYWTAADLWYGATQDLEWYDPDAATTSNGKLTLQLDQFVNHGLNYRSGMLNSWNQVCMKGGALEIGVSLPGPGGAAGLWPGAWTMGNLGRPGYKASTEGLWPYTYNSCDVGITHNQSMTDGTSYLPGQKLPSCTCKGEDHPTPGTGRGAPEIDVFEASADPSLHLGLVTQSYQVAPFDIFYQPNYDFLAIPDYNITQMNGYCGGPFQQAVSGQTELNNQWYDGIQYQKYGFEYTPGSGSQGKITWFVGDDVSFLMTGDAVGPNGNVGYRPISEEPMSIVLNLGFSTAWTGIHMNELRFPTTMYVDYVRWYQASDQQSVTCDPPGYETTQYIKDHSVAYTNYNLTQWDQTGYAWPKHKLNSAC